MKAIMKRRGKNGQKALAAAVWTLIFGVNVGYGEIVVDEGLLETGYREDFGILPMVAGSTWQNHVTVAGWYAVSAGGSVPSEIVVSDGSSNVADQVVASIGQSGSAERALVYHTRVNSNPTYVGLAFRNETGEAINSVRVEYAGEQWREASEQRTLRFLVEYRVGATLAELNATEGWTAMGELSFSSLGGSAGRREALDSGVMEVEVGSGETLWLRWVTSNSATSSTSSNDVIALDDVTVSFGTGLPDIAPEFTEHPLTQTVAVGDNLMLRAKATGRPAPTYQWFKGNMPLEGKTSASLTISDIGMSQGGAYWVRASNGGGVKDSNVALITISNEPVTPTIACHPQSRTIAPGGHAALVVTASGTGPLQYQWLKDDEEIYGATLPRHVLLDVSAADAGTYRVRIRNAAGQVISDPAVVQVALAPDFELLGWATAGEGTTGGAGGPVVPVSDYASLVAAVSQTGPVIIMVSGTITGTGDAIRVMSDKSIIGVGADARLENLGLNIGWNSSFGEIGNVILRNLTFGSVRSPTDKVSISYGAKNVWIDHCDFISDLSQAGSNKDYFDGQLDVTRGAEFVTVSWCRFVDHFKNSLIGHGEGNSSQDSGKLTVTYHHNAFINVNSRNPSVRFGRVHVFNNYYKNIGDYAVASRQNAEVVIENNWFENVSEPIAADTNLSSIPGRVRGLETNRFINCGPNSIITTPATWEPPYPYTLNAVDDVPALVSQWAGVGKLENTAATPLSFTDWLSLFGLDPDPANANLDSDLDGFPDLMEYALGRHPLLLDNYTATLNTLQIDAENYLSYSFLRRMGADDVAISIELAADPSFITSLGSTHISATQVGPATEAVTVRSLVPLSVAPQQFLRIVAE